MAVGVIQVMGRTVPSYRMASDREKRKWKVFREQLDKSEKKHLMK